MYGEVGIFYCGSSLLVVDEIGLLLTNQQYGSQREEDLAYLSVDTILIL